MTDGVIKILCLFGLFPYMFVVISIGIKLFIKSLPVLDGLDDIESQENIKKYINNLSFFKKAQLLYVRMIIEVGVIFLICLCGRKYAENQRRCIDKYLWRGNFLFPIVLLFVSALYAVPLSLIIKS